MVSCVAADSGIAEPTFLDRSEVFLRGGFLCFGAVLDGGFLVFVHLPFRMGAVAWKFYESTCSRGSG